MKRDTTAPVAEAAGEKLFDSWFDPVETALRGKVRGFLETMIEEELETVLARPRYGRRAATTFGCSGGGDRCRPSAWAAKPEDRRHVRGDGNLSAARAARRR